MGAGTSNAAGSATPAAPRGASTGARPRAARRVRGRAARAAGGARTSGGGAGESFRRSWGQEVDGRRGGLEVGAAREGLVLHRRVVAEAVAGHAGGPRREHE